MTLGKFRLFKYLIVAILVLPMFYDYFNILPKSIGYILDLLLVVSIIISRQSLRKKSRFISLYVWYIVVVSIIYLFSIIIHEESMMYFALELRRLVIPLLLYYIITDIFSSYKYASVNLHRFLTIILLIQIPVTIVQFLFYSTFKSLGLFSGLRFYLDAATGTLGGAGHSYLGIIIPLIFIYLYNFNKLKYGVPFLIPLILISSGGGIILFGFVLISLVSYTVLTGPLTHKVRIIGGITVFIVILISMSQTKFVRQNINQYTKNFLFYQEHYIEGGRETFVGQEHKLSRFNGYKFLERHMDGYDYEQLFGLGFEFQNIEGSKKTYSYKNDLNIIIAERGYLGLATHVVFVILVLLYIYKTVKVNRLKQVFIKMLFFITFFIAGFYNQTSRSAVVWLVIIFFMALLENPNQYKRLEEYLKLRKRKLSFRARETVQSGV